MKKEICWEVSSYIKKYVKCLVFQEWSSPKLKAHGFLSKEQKLLCIEDIDSFSESFGFGLAKILLKKISESEERN